MIRVELVEPDQLPKNLAGIAVHQRENVIFLIRRDLTVPQAAAWISRLGEHLTREAVDATIDRGQAAP